MKNKTAVKTLIIVVAFVLYSVALAYFSRNIPVGFHSNDTSLVRFVDNYNFLKDNWYYFDKEKSAIESATDAMTNSAGEYDLYTLYMNKEEAEKYFENNRSDRTGIGITFMGGGEHPIVTDVVHNSPAQKAKLQKGDIIISINGNNLRKLKSDKIQEMILDEKVSKVNLKIQRGNNEYSISLEKAEIESSSQYEIKGNVGYLEITGFTKTTANKVKEGLEYFEKENIKQVIIDLRDNPGGDLEALQDISSFFIGKNKTVIKTLDAQGRIETYKSSNQKQYKNNYALITNSNSASAAEAFAICLNETIGAPIYGQKTFGKGIMQSFHQYPDGSYLKYTNAEWLSPKDNKINRIGVSPTHKLEDSLIYQARSLGYEFEDNIKNDSVNKKLIPFQKALKALGYKIDRVDGYYSQKTNKAINDFKKDNKLTNEKDLSLKVQTKIISRVYEKANDEKNDKVLIKTFKELNK